MNERNKDHRRNPRLCSGSRTRQAQDRCDREIILFDCQNGTKQPQMTECTEENRLRFRYFF
jgi:hypothetical protein